MKFFEKNKIETKMDIEKEGAKDIITTDRKNLQILERTKKGVKNGKTN